MGGGDRVEKDAGDGGRGSELQEETTNRLRDDAYTALKGAGGEKQKAAGNDAKEADNPVSHLKMARDLEKAGNVAGATIEFKKAVELADKMPVEDIKKNLVDTRKKIEDEPNKKQAESMGTFAKGLEDLVAMPFDARVELSKFYGRTGRFPEAVQTVGEALQKGIDPLLYQGFGKTGRQESAEKLQASLSEFAGRGALAGELPKYMDQLDVNKDKFVDQLELRRAALDTSIDERGQQLVKFMRENYPKLMNVREDEDKGKGKDEKGVSKRDMSTFKDTFEDELKKGRKE